LGSSLFARHYSGSRGFFPFLGLLRCFSSPAYRYLPYVFRQEHARITTRRFPHSEIPGSKVGQHLTRAYRSRPRPSSALGAKASTVCPSSLDREEHVVCRYGVFKVRAGAKCPAKRESRARARSLKTQQCFQNGRTSKARTTSQRHRKRRRCAEVDVILGELGSGRKKIPRARLKSGTDIFHQNGQAPTGVIAPIFPRKEVIQPQLPLRLPCYDFTPVTNPTFDGSLPCGLGHRLRVLPASVV
jgi:hypothetical protein